MKPLAQFINNGGFGRFGAFGAHCICDHRGEVVACLAPDGTEVARGLVNYPSDECKQIIGKASRLIPEILGYQDDPELINRENLILMKE